MDIFEPTEKDREILSWFCKPFFNSAIRNLSEDAAVMLIRHIANEWSNGTGVARMIAKIEGTEKQGWVGRLGPDVLLIKAMKEDKA